MLASEDTCESTDVTCTIISSASGSSPVEHLLLLTGGNVPSVADFMDICDNQILKITTSHSSRSSLRDFVAKYPFESIVIVREPWEILTHNSKPEPEWLDSKTTVLSIGRSLTNDCKSVVVELISKDLFRCSLRNKEKKLLTSVVGSLVRKEKRTEIDNILTPLFDLDDPNDDLDVTIVVMVKQQEQGYHHALYKYMAGYLREPVEKQGNEWIMKTVRVKNDSLHHAIIAEFRTLLKTIIGPKILTLWEEKSLPFTIISDKFDFQCQPMPCITPEVISKPDDKRVCLRFPHPGDEKLHLKVWEPASPADAEWSAGNGDEPVRHHHHGGHQAQNAPNRDARSKRDKVNIF